MIMQLVSISTNAKSWQTFFIFVAVFYDCYIWRLTKDNEVVLVCMPHAFVLAELRDMLCSVSHWENKCWIILKVNISFSFIAHKFVANSIETSENIFWTCCFTEENCMSLFPNSLKKFTLRVPITRSSVHIFEINSTMVSNFLNITLANPHPLSN